MKGFLERRLREQNFDKEMEINDDTVAWLKKDIKRILATPSIIKNYIPNAFDATRGICIRIGAIMENMNGKIQTRVGDGKMDTRCCTLESVCFPTIFIYQDEQSKSSD